VCAVRHRRPSEVVSLAGGMPNLTTLPLSTLAVEVADLVARERQLALHSAQNVSVLREQICDVMALE
jgi:2-aminoadipate transaminase